MKLFFLITLTLILTISCSRKRVKKAKPIYSQEVENEFASIERERAVERYRRLRAKSWNSYKKVPTRSLRAPKVKVYTQKKDSQKRPSNKKYKRVDPVELEKEIEQNMAIYCMSNRNNPKFDSEQSCVNGTQKIYNDCKGKFNSDDRGLYSCVKSRL